MKSNLIALGFIAATVLTLSWRVAQKPETFRGIPEAAPDAMTPEQFADELALSIELMRAGGMEPSRYNFQLPEGWAPPEGWEAPAGFQPPDWFPK